MDNNQYYAIDEQSQNFSGLINHVDANDFIGCNENGENEDDDSEDEEDEDGETENANDDAGDLRNSNVVIHVGMEFPTDEEAYITYNSFAKLRGFSVRKSTSARNKDGVINRKKFVCSKEGHKSLKDKREQGREVKRRKQHMREGCPARIIIHRIRDDVRRVTLIHDQHSHPLLSTPSKISTLRSHCVDHLKASCKSLMDQFHDCGAGPSQIADLINTTGGDNLVDVTPQQIIDYFKSKRRNNMGRQCVSVIQQFIERQAADIQFYYALELDAGGTCRSIFWADGKARASYMQFTDVMVFDVTYKTNSFLMPFAPFTGVNHHRQSSLFGCALLADEKEETFVWLFQQWLKCMWGKAPAAIITDQDPAICNAIKRVFPKTLHRYCIWHITLHEDEHLRSLRRSFETFDEDYKKWSRYSKTIEESEKCWVALNEKYRRIFEEPLSEKAINEMKSWRWLQNMYDQRHHWVEAYLKDMFFAGMRSSQRSESMNSFFDGFINSMTPLFQFVERYDKALAARRKKEEREDTRCLTTKPDFQGMHDMEACVAKVYTANLFEIFQNEFRNVFHCWHNMGGIEENFTTYNVVCKIDGKINTHNVKCNPMEEFFKCSCSMFETDDVLCKHILYVMKQILFMQTIPKQYILSRWTLGVRHNTTKGRGAHASVDLGLSTNAENRAVTPLDSWRLRAKMIKVIDLVAENRDLYEKTEEFINSMLQQCNLNHEEETSTQVSYTPTPSYLYHITITDATKNTHKGRPAIASRIPSGIEVSQSKAQNRSRTCSNCHEKGHDIRTCQLLKAPDASNGKE